MFNPPEVCFPHLYRGKAVTGSRCKRWGLIAGGSVEGMLTLEPLRGSGWSPLCVDFITPFQGESLKKKNATSVKPDYRGGFTFLFLFFNIKITFMH